MGDERKGEAKTNEGAQRKGGESGLRALSWRVLVKEMMKDLVLREREAAEAGGGKRGGRSGRGREGRGRSGRGRQGAAGGVGGVGKAQAN